MLKQFSLVSIINLVPLKEKRLLIWKKTKVLNIHTVKVLNIHTYVIILVYFIFRRYVEWYFLHEKKSKFTFLAAVAWFLICVNFFWNSNASMVLDYYSIKLITMNFVQVLRNVTFTGTISTFPFQSLWKNGRFYLYIRKLSNIYFWLKLKIFTRVAIFPEDLLRFVTKMWHLTSV